MKSKKQELGQFLTNPNIARFMSELVYNKNAQIVLDPAVGEGIFLQCLKKNKTDQLQFIAYDVDETMIDKSKSCVKANVEYINKDYLLSEIETQPDIIICNPPYSKFQEITNRKEYIKLFKERYNFKISGYSNLCVYFLIKSLFELKVGGKCAYIIPFEFLNTGYGEQIKEFFIQSKYLKTIYKFDSNIPLFDDALTTSCILLFEKKEHENVEFILVEDINEVDNKYFKNVKSYSYGELNHKEKWNIYFSAESAPMYNNLIDFSKIAKVKRGVATGGNAFFALNKDQIDSLGLSSDTLVRCVCKSPDIKNLVFKEKDFHNLYLSNKKVFIFNGEQATSKNDFEYIKFGEENNYNKSYLNSHRSPWYSLEKKEIAPIWISVFNRASLKVVRNETQTKNLTSFHGVYLNDDYNNDRYINIFFCYLLTPICRRLLQNSKREYGGGLDKFEPNDLNNARIINISLITDDDSARILDLYQQLKSEENNSTKIIQNLNNIFESYLV